MPRKKTASMTDDNAWQSQFIDETVSGDGIADPLDSLSVADQDLFFRMLDTIDDPLRRQEVMAYLMDHAAIVRSVVDYAKQQQAALRSDNIALMEQFLQREKVVLETIEAEQSSDDDFGSSASVH